MLPLFPHTANGRKKMWNSKVFCENFPMPEREAMVVAPQTLVVYAPFAQLLNVVVLRFVVRCNVDYRFVSLDANLKGV